MRASAASLTCRSAFAPLRTTVSACPACSRVVNSERACHCSFAHVPKCICPPTQLAVVCSDEVPILCVCFELSSLVSAAHSQCSVSLELIFSYPPFVSFDVDAGEATSTGGAGVDGMVLMWGTICASWRASAQHTTRTLFRRLCQPRPGYKPQPRVEQFQLFAEPLELFQETARPLLCAGRVHRWRRRSGPVLSRITGIDTLQ